MTERTDSVLILNSFLFSKKGKEIEKLKSAKERKEKKKEINEILPPPSPRLFIIYYLSWFLVFSNSSDSFASMPANLS